MFIFSRVSKLVISFAGLNSRKKLPVSNIMIIPRQPHLHLIFMTFPEIPVNRPSQKRGDLVSTLRTGVRSNFTSYQTVTGTRVLKSTVEV